MKVKDLLQDFFETTGPLPGPGIAANMKDYVLMPEQLSIEDFKKRLLECEEFENTKELVIIDKPIMKHSSGKLKTVQTMFLTEGIKFKEKVYLYNIFLSPETYETAELTKPVKDDILVLPTLFDSETFTPRKGLTVFWSPEQRQDFQASYDKSDEEFIKEQIIDKVRKALESPGDYKPKAKRKIAMRLLPESVETTSSDMDSNIVFQHVKL
jgi:hypothetical protein